MSKQSSDLVRPECQAECWTCWYIGPDNAVRVNKSETGGEYRIVYHPQAQKLEDDIAARHHAAGHDVREIVKP